MKDLKGLLYAIVIIVLVTVLFKGKKDVDLTPTKQEVKVVERIIEKNTIEIVKQKGLADQELLRIKELSREVNELRGYLDAIRDTSTCEMIVYVQDTLIVALNEENEGLYNLVDIKDSVISLQDEVISAKDTVISSLEVKYKKLKRQRNIAVGVAIAEGVIIGGILLKK